MPKEFTAVFIGSYLTLSKLRLTLGIGSRIFCLLKVVLKLLGHLPKLEYEW